MSDHTLRIVAFVLGAIAVGGALPFVWHLPRRWPLAVAVVLLGASAMAEHIERWSRPVPVIATCLDIAGFAVLIAWFWTVRRDYLRVSQNGND